MNGDFSLAVHALVFLNHKRTTVSSEALSNNICAHSAHVRKIMAQLKRSNFVSPKWRFGSVGNDCLISSGMGEVMDNIYFDLNDLCYQKLESITLADIDRLIFKNKETS